MRLLSRALNLEESPLAQEQLESAQERALEPLDRREWRAEAVVGGALLLAAIALAVFAAPGQRDADPLTAVLLTLALALASRVEFDVVGWYTIAAQIVLVPMLFALAPALVPLLAALALVVAKLPEVAAGKRPASRAVMGLGDAWFTVGPALLLTAAGAPGAGDVAAWLLLAALAAQFCGDFVSAWVRERLAGGGSLREQLRHGAFIYGIDALLAPLGFLAALAAEQRPWATALLLVPAVALLGLLAVERRWRIDYVLELSRAYRGTATLLGDVVEADHAYTGDHSREVVELALAVAEQMDLSPYQRRRVEFGALLHDVGKIAVPKEVIDKPGRLDEAEWELMRRHTIEGETMLRKVGGVLGEAGEVVRASHEHWDGSGYPDALAGEAIPVEARIVSCCDAYSAMTTDRSYRRARSSAAALAELRRCAATQFDPAVVDALARALGMEPADGEARPRRFARGDAAAPALSEAER